MYKILITTNTISSVEAHCRVDVIEFDTEEKAMVAIKNINDPSNTLYKIQQKAIALF